MIHLRTYQQQGVEAIRAAFRRCKRVLYVAPTGSGKTVLFSYIGKAMTDTDKRVYILVHRAELVDQVCRTLDEFGVKYGVIAAGTEPRAARVQVASVFTLVNRIQNYPEPDLIIVDEAHHAAAGSWDRVFAHWRRAFVLGVTATPIRLDGKSLGGSFDEMVLGPTVSDLMATGALSAYRIYMPPTALGKMRMRFGDYVKLDTEREMNKPKLIGDAVDHYSRLALGKRAIAFCTSLEHASNTESEFRSAGFRAARIDGSMERGERRQLVQSFARGQMDVLTSCDLISEGFDIPAAKCAILMRPTASLGLYRQQVGRVLRPDDGDAIILDHAGNALRHGLPDDEIDWTLDDEHNGRRRAKSEAQSVRLCGQCYAANKSGTMVCLYCGWQWPVASRTVKEVEGELIEATGLKPKGRTMESINKAREVGMATTFDELKEIARQRNYKEGWVTNIWRAKQAKAAKGAR